MTEDTTVCILAIPVQQFRRYPFIRLKNGTDCYYFDTFEEAENFVTKTLVDNDLLITMGAGDVVNIADELLSKR